ncbi:MAG: hypothetical protein WCO03_00535 [bacterium]
MSITETAEKGKQIWNKVKSESRTLLIVLLIILTASLSYGLGRMSKEGDTQVPIALIDCAGSPKKVTLLDGGSNGNALVSNQAASVGKVNKVKEGQVFASKNGKKYYYSWCSGGNRIKVANKVFFDTSALAEAAGYTIAAGCK